MGMKLALVYLQLYSVAAQLTKRSNKQTKELQKILTRRCTCYHVHSSSLQAANGKFRGSCPGEWFAILPSRQLAKALSGRREYDNRHTSRSKIGNFCFCRRENATRSAALPYRRSACNVPEVEGRERENEKRAAIFAGSSETDATARQ